MTAVDPHVKRLLLSLLTNWNPACDECGLRHASVKGELYTISTKKNGYTLKRKRWGRICQFCCDKAQWDAGLVPRFIGMDLAKGPELTVGYVYAPYVPEGLLGAGGRLLR